MGGVLWLFVQLATDPTQEKLGPIRFCMSSKSVLLQLHWFPLRHSSTKLHYCSVLISRAGKGATQSGEMRLLHICNQSCGASNSIMHSAVPCGVLFRAYQERSGHVRFTCTRRKRTNPPAWPP